MPADLTHDSAARRRFQARLRSWYRRSARPLPWRDEPSLYKTVVSEFMLQQTQVSTVLPYFARWLKELPDFAALAAAPVERVLKLWEGLGYYTRARNLHRLAQALVARSTPPRTPTEWRELPGIGPYTAAAITSIAIGVPTACVDGNVVRILARLTGETRAFRDSTAAAKHFAALAESLVPAKNPGDHNQAMMELGATVCVRRAPRCSECPVSQFCIAQATDTAEDLPRLAPKKMEARLVRRLWCVDAQGRLLLRRSETGRRQLAGLHELPELDEVGLALRQKEKPLTVKRRTITRFQITEEIYTRPPDAALRHAANQSTLEWVPLDELSRVTLSGPHRRWIHELANIRAATNA